MRPIMENKALRAAVIRESPPGSPRLQPLIVVPKPSAQVPSVTQKPKLASLNPAPAPSEQSQLPPIANPLDLAPAQAPSVIRPLQKGLVAPIRAAAVMAKRAPPRPLDDIQPVAPPSSDEIPDEPADQMSGRPAPLSIIEHARRNVKSRIRA
jgi:hypothetical protein